MPVPNCFPKLKPDHRRLAVIGDVPGQDEVTAGEPFVGSAGRLLRAVLGQTGIATDQVFYGNICQHPVKDDDIRYLDWSGPEIQSGLSSLTADLHQFQPNACLLVGEAPVRAFMGRETPIPLANMRGTILSGGPVYPSKMVVSYHPSYIFKSYTEIPLFKLDVHRAVRHSAFPELQRPVRNGNLNPTLDEVLTFCSALQVHRRPVAFDIEGYADDIGCTMLSLCDSASTGIVIPFWQGSHYWTEEQEVFVWQAVARVLADPQVPKIAHNSFYELFVLAWRHRCLIRNLADDTMMAHWELFPEFASKKDEGDTGTKNSAGAGRDLGLCCSIYTEEPYYKHERLSDDPQTKLAYNFKDSACTYEIRDVVEQKLRAIQASYTHYRFNINLIPPLTYLHLRGCRLDLARKAEITQKTEHEVLQLQTEISTALGRDFNVKSYLDKQWLLFDYLKVKPDSRKGKSTEEAILLKWWTKTQSEVLRLVIRCIRKRTYLSDINKLVPNHDGRIRSSYDLVGTNTGRLSSRASQALHLIREELKKSIKTYWDETGTNMQNVTKDLRVCFIPDTLGHDFWQFDLSGADGWTVGADLAALGHPTMLEDYLKRIKPALVLVLMLKAHEAGENPAALNLLSRDELSKRCAAVKADYDAHEGEKLPDGRPYDWQYYCCKKIQHGSNYGARPEKIAELIFADSDATIALTKREAELYQYFYKLRYKTDTRNDWIRKQLAQSGALTAACGIRRQFFGIRNRYDIDDNIVREASAFEPQANTTWATNKALERLWYSNENRTSRGSLFIEPLLQIHDALAGQYRSDLRPWAGEHLKTWFNNPLTIHGIPVTIPAEGNWGPNWKETNQHIK